MLRFQNGDISAFDELMNRNRKSVINTIYRYVGNRDHAEELAQEVFLRVYKSSRKYKPKAKFSTWLYKIVTNLCLNELRKKRADVIPIHELADDSGSLIDVSSSAPDHGLERRERISMVRKSIESLPDKQRMAVILREYEGMSYREIAEAMGCSVASVQSRLQRAKVTLRERLTPYLQLEQA
jgi:RNA polymerase sigma-70 factor (ECF subfamily)